MDINDDELLETVWEHNKRKKTVDQPSSVKQHRAQV
jgi:hypothetical protein